MADYAQTGSLETLTAIMDFHGGLPDGKTARSILQLRYYLEAPAMEELAARRSPSDIAALRALQRQAEEASTRDVQSLAEALFRYHRGVTFLSGNTITPLLFNAFTRVNLGFGRATSAPRAWPAAWSGWHSSRNTSPPGTAQPAAQLLRTGLEEFMARME